MEHSQAFVGASVLQGLSVNIMLHPHVLHETVNNWPQPAFIATALTPVQALQHSLMGCYVSLRAYAGWS
eukprot:1160396-Pelagomonas_calceolata.AAC.27